MSTGASCVKPHSRELPNHQTLNFILGSVHSSNQQVIMTLEQLCKLVPHGSQLSAMVAPGSVIENKHVFVLLVDCLVPSCTNDGVHFILNGGDLLGFEMDLCFTWFKVINERLKGGDSHLCKFSLVEVSFHFVTGLEDSECGRELSCDHWEISETLLNTIFCTCSHEENFTFKRMGCLFENLVKGRCLVVSVQDQTGQVLFENRFNEIISELNQSG